MFSIQVSTAEYSLPTFYLTQIYFPYDATNIRIVKPKIFDFLFKWPQLTHNFILIMDYGNNPKIFKLWRLILKHLIIILLILSCFGCVSYPGKDFNNENTTTELQETKNQFDAIDECIGNVNPPVDLADKFEAVEDDELLQKALGQPGKGSLCQGKVYETKEGTHIVIYRAWNSTNPNSAMGKWWAFERPTGKVSQYRSDYEICYQWSPLDKLVSGTLKAGTKIVIGTGQSAKCSDYLTYAVSAEKQIYVENASDVVGNSTTYDGEFSWKVIIE